MQKISYQVQDLHCSEEVNILKKALKARPGIGPIDFHLLSKQLTIFYDPSKIDSQEISALIASTGMRATIYSEKAISAVGFWEDKGPLIMCTLSALFLISALIFQYLAYPNMWDILTSHHEETPPGISIFLYIASIITGGWFVFPKAYYSALRFIPDINLLMTIASVGALCIQQWFEGGTVMFLFSVAELLEHWSIRKAHRTISSLLGLAPDVARVIDKKAGNVEKKVEEVKVGEQILIRPGEKIPLDAVITKGSSSVNQASITGEFTPVFKQDGDLVFAGTINEESPLECRVLKTAQDSTVAHIVQLVEEARNKRATYEQWVERFARIYTPIILILALLVMFLPPLFFGISWSESIYRALVLLVIACPCALVISTPVCMVSGLTAAARSGFLIKGAVFLEAIGRLKAIALDKTGTMTLGHPLVQQVIPLNDYSTKEVLELAATLEKHSDHPLARALLKKAEEENILGGEVEDLKMIKGAGAEGTISGQRFWIGSHRLMHEKGQETEAIHLLALELEDAGHSVIALGNQTHICGLISIADEPRKHIKETFIALRGLGLKHLIMLTGDNKPTASALAKITGIDSFKAELMPEDKVKEVHRLCKEYKYVAMIGDGINDAPALAAATVGIAMGAIGSDVAFETADIVLMSDELSLLPRLIGHSRRVLRVLKANIAFSLGLKAIFLILAISGLATLWMAIAADTGASLIVVFNALRLLRF